MNDEGTSVFTTCVDRSVAGVPDPAPNRARIAGALRPADLGVRIHGCAAEPRSFLRLRVRCLPGLLRLELVVAALAFTAAATGWFAVFDGLAWGVTLGSATVAIGGWRIVAARSRALTIAGSRLVFGRGVLVRRVRSIALDQIIAVGVSRSRIEKLFGSGRIEIAVRAGRTRRIVIAHVGKPDEVVEAVTAYASGIPARASAS